MAQAALSLAAFQTAYPSAEPRRPAPPRPSYVETAYDPVVRTRAPYPSAMRRARRRARLTTLIALTGVSLAGWAVFSHPQGPARPEAESVAAAGPAAVPVPQAAAAPRPSLAWMLDRSPALGAGTATAFGGETPPVAGFQVAAAAPSPAVREIARQVAQAERARAAQVRMAQAKAAEKVAERVADRTGERTGEKGTGAPVRMAAAEPTPAALAPAPVPALVPLPVARPPELRRAPAPPARVASRALPRTRDVFRAAMAEEPSFFEKLFGVGAAAPSQDSRQDSRQEPRQALAYASPDALPQEAPRTRISPEPDSVAGTAVYDITARTVTLPSGEVLEAHSGLGEHMDNPRYVHLRMRGSTPPGTYTLTERERLFHGVRAIRLNPVGGSAAIHGRDGLLAHTYMLRQPGASNGCVSFRDYNRFLQAFLRGEVRRLVVVAGSGDGGGILNRIGLAGRRGGRG
ncbi:DUF2778 domain-containing protein [Methylobacterium sp. Leaf361]|uniref:DUF2778 domain-containing protein n=1 Tax=Methylobacterium sp. Leaf361 TaxID=1736352 RepID=UPI0006F36BFA|nr:DUF2778 domain-containing protein [Methylobacterium sp. Leaf361]KQS85285.1 hypothetical protein ASG32_18735 [Methylobacterium sp. Leaf361]